MPLRGRRALRFLAGFLLITSVGILGGDAVSLAQQPAQTPPPQKQPAPPQRKTDDYRIRTDVNLVVLHTSVVDERGHAVTDLKQDNFRVYEDRVEQKLAVFRREDVPVTVGLVIDNSGSMKDKRERVNTAALTFVKTSNPQDEVFVVNFNDEYFLDLDKDFTSDINEMKEALERIDARGATALYDAVQGSLDHIKKGTRDKKVLLVITDGEDTASRAGSLEMMLLAAQKSEALIYAVGLLGSDRKARKARDVLKKMAEASGGLAFFPETLADVEPICTQIAHDIRNQYTLAYYPSNSRKDGSFRAVKVDLVSLRNRGKLSVRTRNGYYAQSESTGY